MPISRRALLAGTAGAAAAALAAACAPDAVRRQAGPAGASQTSGGPNPSDAPGGHALSTPRSSPAPSATQAPRGPAVEIAHGPRTAKAIALTFHGSGDPTLARALLTAAEQGGAHVTVLAVGQWLAANPTLAARILDAGHELGNHTFTHPVLPRLGRAATEREIVGCRDVLVRLAGSAGKWFRPSGTQHATPLILALAGPAGYPTSLSYDVDPRDYQDPGATAVRERALAAVRGGSIVSLHLGHAGTVTALPGLLTGLRERGLQAVTVSQLLTS